eukprot:m.42602 g.42602  ORF g.42602 m.42602 type:complete len:457 (-) comp9895_c0_seq1:82-1452(-)
MCRNLEKRGIRVFIVQETATMLFTNGCTKDLKSRDERISLQTEILRLQISMEDTFHKLAKEHTNRTRQQCVILCDRGTMDGRGYLSAEEWEKVKKNVGGLTDANLRDERYDAVLHLVTAADGAEKFYTLENNQARTETFLLARQYDEGVRHAWVGHPNITIFPNIIEKKVINFETKLRNVVKHVSEAVGIETPTNRARMFVLKDVPKFPENVKIVELDVEKIFLTPHHENITHAILRRSPADNPTQQTHSLTTCTLLPDNTTIEQRRILKPKAYDEFSRDRNPKCNILKQRRYYCNDKELDLGFFEVIEYKNPEANNMITLTVHTLCTGSTNDKKSEKRPRIGSTEDDVTDAEGSDYETSKDSGHSTDSFSTTAAELSEPPTPPTQRTKPGKKPKRLPFPEYLQCQIQKEWTHKLPVSYKVSLMGTRKQTRQNSNQSSIRSSTSCGPLSYSFSEDK